MRYKTIIKIITEATDKNEAMEIAGEYLSGNLTTGVDMKLRTIPVCSNKQRLGIALAASFIIALLAIPLSYVKHTENSVQILPSNSVIQPPLKTSSGDVRSSFKKEWQAKHTQEALDSLKR